MKKKRINWKELENLSKDELLIRMVRAEYRYDLLKEMVASLGKNGVDGIGSDALEESYPIEWALKIAEFHLKNHDIDDFYPSDLSEYGMDEKTCNTVYAILRHRGIITDDSHDWEGMFEGIEKYDMIGNTFTGAGSLGKQTV